jgi:hypothetical protein
MAGVEGVTNVRVREAFSGQPIGRPLPHSQPVALFTFSPVDNRIATAEYGGTVYLWDAEAGGLIGAPLHEDAEVSVLRFDPAGRRLAVVMGRDIHVHPIAGDERPAGRVVASAEAASALRLDPGTGEVTLLGEADWFRAREEAQPGR